MGQQAIDIEKRQFSRIAFDSPVILHNDDGHWDSKMLDISLKGVLINRPDDWDETADENYQLEINLGEGGFDIHMDIRLVHFDESKIGFSCENIDLDSIIKLRRLVELNIGDEQLLERQIGSMFR